MMDLKGIIITAYGALVAPVTQIAVILDLPPFVSFMPRVISSLANTLLSFIAIWLGCIPKVFYLCAVETLLIYLSRHYFFSPNLAATAAMMEPSTFTVPLNFLSG
jgi:hypothetical protein